MIEKTFQENSRRLPFQDFGAVIGRMMVSFDEISQQDYRTVGEIQARTVVLAEAYENKTAVRDTILKAFEGRDGKLDLNGPMFAPNATPESIINKLDVFIGNLGLSDADEMLAEAREAVAEEKGVHEKAAAAGVILKAFFMDGDRDAKEAIVDGALIMQLATRGLKRVDAIIGGQYDASAALALQSASNKMNLESDPKPLKLVNASLLSVCTTEIDCAINLAEETASFEELSAMYEGAVSIHLKRMVDNMSGAVELFQFAGRERLSARAEAMQKQCYKRYAEYIGGPYIMGQPKLRNASTNPE